MKKFNIIIGMFLLLFISFLSSCSVINSVNNTHPTITDFEEDDKKTDNNKTIIHNVTFEDKKVVYDGKEHSIFIQDDLPNEVFIEYINNGQVNAGSYQVTARLTSNSPEIIIEQEEFYATLTIEKKKIQDVVSFEDRTVEYNYGENFIYADNVPEGVEIEYINNGQIEVGSYIVEAKFIDSTGNYDCSSILEATLTITKSSKLKVINFYNENQEQIKQIELMEGSYITSDLMPNIKYEIGYNYSWDYDFYVKVSCDLHIHLIKTPKEFKLYYYFDNSFEENVKIKEENVKYNQVVDIYNHEYDEYTYAYKYKAYYKNNSGEYKPLLNNDQEVIIDGSYMYIYQELQDLYLVPLKSTRNIKFEYELDYDNNIAIVSYFFNEEVVIPRAIYEDGKEFIITKIKEGASESHGFLTSLKVTKDSELKEIGDRAFKWSELAYIELPNSIEYIGEEALYSTKVSEIIVLKNKNDVEIIYGEDAFAYCENLKYISIPKWENKDIYHLFDSTELNNLTINIEELNMEENGYSSFFGGYLNTLKINSGNISYGFYNILSLENLYIEKDVYFIAEVPNVNNVYVEKSLNEWIDSYFFSINLNPAYHSNYFYVYENNEYVLCPKEISVSKCPNKGALNGIKQIEKIIFEEGIDEIIESSCSNIPNLKEVYISSTVKKINNYAFYNCRSLEKVEISNNSMLEKIEGSVFYYTGLKEINLPLGLIKIGDLTFAETNLIEIYIPKSVEIIGNNTFGYCGKLKTITFEKGSSLNKIYDGAFRSEIESIYFGITEEQWQNIEFDQTFSEGLFLYHHTPKCYFLDNNNEYYLVENIQIPNKN